MPFSLVDTSLDLDRNGLLTNEYLPAGTYSGVGPDGFTVEYKGGRNGARGHNYQRLDLRMGYRIRLGGGRTIDAFLDLFNATNEPNFANPIVAVAGVGNNSTDRRIAATFLTRTQTLNESPTRTAQLNLRYGF